MNVVYKYMTRMTFQYRTRQLGYRTMFGILILQGAIVEKLIDDKWVYVDCMHPEDAHYYVIKMNAAHIRNTAPNGT